jgi:hypothetical protein
MVRLVIEKVFEEIFQPSFSVAFGKACALKFGLNPGVLKTNRVSYKFSLVRCVCLRLHCGILRNKSKVKGVRFDLSVAVSLATGVLFV